MADTSAVASSPPSEAASSDKTETKDVAHLLLRQLFLRYLVIMMVDGLDDDNSEGPG